MLVLSLRSGEFLDVIMADGRTFRLRNFDDRRQRFGIEAPQDVAVTRSDAQRKSPPGRRLLPRRTSN